MAPRILAVSGSTRAACRTRALLDVAIAGAREGGAEVRILDLHDHPLPMFQESEPAQGADPNVRRARADAEWAQGFLLATPEYHGSLSGALKNWFDFHYRELTGKLAGVLAATGGGGGDMSIVAAKTSFQWCHGFVLPFHAAARSDDFDGMEIRNDRVRDRAFRVGRDVARYAPVLFGAFEEARRLGRAPAAGFAGL